MYYYILLKLGNYIKWISTVLHAVRKYKFSRKVRIRLEIKIQIEFN